MNTTGQDKPGDKPGATPNHVWVPVLVAAISATSAIAAAVIMRPTPPPPAAQGIADVASTTGGPAQTATPPVATPASATTATPSGADYRAQVLGYLDRQHTALTDAGYRRDVGTDDWVGLLQVGTPKVWEVQLARGVDYQVVGVCDSDCKDVDMEVYDMAGGLIGGDTVADDYPRVQFRPAQSGPHTVKVWLRNCNVADGTHACVVAVRLLRR